MASEGSRRLEEALSKEVVKLKSAEMEPSSGIASASASAEDIDSEDEMETASVAASAVEQRVKSFMKNLYPRWGIDIGSDESRTTRLAAALFEKDEYLTRNIRSTLLSSGFGRAYDALGGGTALHWAVRMEDLHLVTRILEEGQEDVNTKDEWWKATALHWAVRIGNMDIVNVMCTDHLASRKFDLGVKDKWGFTALECAIFKSNVPMVEALLQFANEHLDRAGVIEEIKDVVCRDGSMEVLQPYFDSHRETWFNRVRFAPGTFLHWAVNMEDSALATQILSENKVDVNAVDSHGYTPFHLAVWSRNLDMVKIMVAEDKVDTIVKDTNGYTPLHLAVSSRNLDMVKCLVIDCRVRVNVEDTNGYTPFHLAVLSRNLDMVKLMVAMHLEWKIFNFNSVETKTGYTILHHAILNGEEENIAMVRELLKCKETMRLIGECHTGETPLQIAHERGFKDIEKSLLECTGVQRYVDDLYRDRQVYVDAANAILVGAALIAGVTFASWLQPPLGYGTLGYVDVQNDRGLRAFWVFNCFSFYFAIATVVCGAQSVLPRSPYFIKVTVEKLRKNLLVTASLLACSVFFVLIAFGIAGCLVLSPTIAFQLYMIIPTIIGGLVCVASLVSLSKSVWQDSSFGKNTALIKEEEWNKASLEKAKEWKLKASEVGRQE